MILSVSRRTDVPAYYTEWFLNRLKEGYALVRSPASPRQVSRISLSPDVVDGIVFWTKDPRPLAPHLDRLRDYPYYFQFTLTPYGQDIEPGLPDKEIYLLPAFRALAEKLGPHRVIWRYDPVFFTSYWTPERHLEAFSAWAALLRGCTRQVVISFLDFYPGVAAKLQPLGLYPADAALQKRFAAATAAIAWENGLQLTACAEETLAACGIPAAACVDRRLLEQLCGYPLKLDKDKGQRPACGCAQSVDIGAYGTCRCGCLYCYAGGAKTRAPAMGDNASPLLCGTLGPYDKVTERKAASSKQRQLQFY